MYLEDFLRFNKIGIDWSPKGDLSLSCMQQILIESMDISMEGPKIYIKHEVNIPVRTLAILEIGVDIQRKDLDKLYDIQPNYLLTNEYPNLVIIPTLHRIGGSELLVTQALDPKTHNILADKKTQIH